jgi:hypothetical protein
MTAPFIILRDQPQPDSAVNPPRDVLRLASLDTKREPVTSVDLHALLDRGWGKARQALEHSGGDGGAVKHSIEVRFVAAPEREE